jgi:rhodanese-related sulfurtransferase
MSASRPPVEVVSKEEVKRGVREGTIALVDVREAEEYAAGHIPGAVSMPLSTLNPEELPRDKRVVFSCNSGRRTLRALEHVQAAGRADVKAHYAGSFNEWKASGEPIDTE